MSPHAGGPLDWTEGADALAFEACRACGAVRYFRRGFCPACGSHAVETRIASGDGTVYALTRVVRAPSAEWREHAPYSIALVDAAEGFRFLAHAAGAVAIGDPVRTRFRAVGANRVPVVEPAGSGP